MYGKLPTALLVDGKEYEIDTDFRNCLTIFTAFNDPDLTIQEKQIIMLKRLYKEVPDNVQEALTQAKWFLDCGQEQEEHSEKPLFDWEQDEQMIFSAVNKVAGHEVRMDEYMHFWTFIGLFHGIGEGLFSTVVNIRDKRNRGKKLDKTDQEFYERNKKLVKLEERLSAEEQANKDRINKLFS